MADTNTEQFFKDLVIALRAEGIEDIQAALNSIISTEKRLNRTTDQITEKYGDTRKAAQELAKEYAKLDKEADKSAKKQKKHLGGLISSYGVLGRGISEATSALKGMVIPSSFGSAIKTVIDYNKGMLNLSASVNRLGISLTGLESSLRRIGLETSLTREETNKLFQQYQEGMRFVSLSGFESILSRVKDMVGANAEEMGKYIQTVSTLSQKYPVLTSQIEALSKAGGTATEQQKKAIEDKVRDLYLIGQISDAEYKRTMSLVRGNQQMSKADKARQEEMQAAIKAQQEYKQQIEDVKKAFGEAILPALQKIVSWIRDITKGTDEWVNKAVSLLAVLGSIKVAMMAIKAINTLGLSGAGVASGIGSGLAGIGSGLGKINKMGPGGMAVGGAAALIGGGMIKSQAAGLEKQGKHKTAGAATLGGSLLQVGGSALSGAAMGSMIGGPIGAAVGGVVGALTGVVSNLDDLKKGWNKMWGRKDKEPRSKSKFSEKDDFRKKWKDDYEDRKESKRIQKTIEDESVKDKAKWEKGGSRAVLEDTVNDKGEVVEKGLRSQRVDALADLETETEKSNKRIRDQFKETFGKDYKVDMKEGKEAEAIKAVLDRNQEQIAEFKKFLSDNDKYLTETEKDTEGAKLATLEETRKKMIEIKDAEKERGTPLAKANAKYTELQGRLERVIGLMQQQRQIAESLNSLYAAQAGKVSAVIEKMSLSGKIDMPELDLEVDKALLTLKASVKKDQEHLDNLRLEKKLFEQIGSEQLSKAGLTIKQKEKYSDEIERGLNGEQAALEKLEEIEKVDTRITKETAKQTDILNSMTEAIDGQLKLDKARATQAGLMVQLGDNFAIGVRASADMRIRAFDAEEKIIKDLKVQLKLQDQAIAKAGADVSTAQLEKRVDLENQIYQSQIKQAQQVKALRDGWVHALSAMNTGMGGFTEIIMSADDGLAQMQRLSGGVRSTLHGAFARGDEDVGYRKTEQYGTRQGQIAGRADTWRPAFKADTTGDFDMRSLEKGLTRQVGEMAASQANKMRAAGGTMHGASNKIALGAYVAGDRRPITNNSTNNNSTNNNPITNNSTTNNRTNNNSTTNNSVNRDSIFNNPTTNNPITNNSVNRETITNNLLTNNSVTKTPAPVSTANAATANINVPIININSDVNVKDLSEVVEKCKKTVDQSVRTAIKEVLDQYPVALGEDATGGW
jgi:hypothetical protein